MALVTEDYFTEADISFMENINPSGIARPTKKLNATHKAENHAANKVAEAEINSAFNTSRSTNKPWSQPTNPAGPYVPKRYTKSSVSQDNDRPVE